MSNRLIVVGGGGFSQEVCWLAQTIGYEITGFLDDAAAGGNVLGLPVLGGVADWVKHADHEFVIAIGNPRTRCRVVARMAEYGQPRFATLIHPAVHASPWVSIGEGSVITAGCIITTEVVIGRHVIINLNCTVGHECRIGDYVTIAPLVAVSGNVTLRDLVEIGTGAVVRQGLEIGEGAMLGMGGVLTKPMESGAVYVGNPAKFLKTLEA